MLHPDQIIAAYIMASRRNGTLYTGMTTDLSRRIYEHRERTREGFTKRYGCRRLVWWESFELITAAISRERTLKGYPRAWKLNLIEAENPDGGTCMSASTGDGRALDARNKSGQGGRRAVTYVR